MKKTFASFLLIASLFITSQTFAATTVSAPLSVGTYNDFGQNIRLDINPKYTNAAQFEIDYASGYNATRGFKTKLVSAETNYKTPSRQYVCRTGVNVSSFGWWTIKVYSIAADGTKSATDFQTNVNVTR